jgi:uncharacterized repeat protein (TIGR04138 family)
MSTINPRLFEVTQRDPRYAYEAYEFLFEALQHTQRGLDRAPGATDDPSDARHHVTAQELLRGICSLALLNFGMMARAVLAQWGVRRTDDFGEIVRNLVQADLLKKTEDDRLEDFQNAFDLDEALRHYQIELDE